MIGFLLFFLGGDFFGIPLSFEARPKDTGNDCGVFWRVLLSISTTELPHLVTQESGQRPGDDFARWPRL